MFTRKGLTFMEMMVVIVIIGILCAIALPNYFNDMYQTKVQSVAHNLMAIGAAEQKYYEDQGSYYTTPNDGLTHFDAINQNLSLSMASQNDGFIYTCPSSGASFTCSASSASPNQSVSVASNGTLSCAGMFNTCP